MSQAGDMDVESSHPQIPTSFITDNGTAIPLNNELEILGDNGITTEGSGNTVTVLGVNATAGTSLTATVGVASFDEDSFQVTNGFVEFIGGGSAIEQITPQTGFTVTPNMGNVNFSGTYVTATSVPVQTNGTAADTVKLEVQLASENAFSNPVNAGLASFDSAAFNVDASGFVQLVGSGIPSTSFDVQANTAPGTDPVIPDGSGIVTVNGAAVANHSVVLETRSRAANTYNIEVQYATTSAATDATKSGVCHFDSTDFTVDASGFVALAGAGAGQTITGNSGGALTPTAGNWNILGGSVAAGTSPVATAGAGSTLTVNVQRAQAIAAQDTTKVGLCNFDSSQFTVTNGFVQAIGATATDYHVARYIVSAGGAADGANYTTIASAITAAAAAGGVQTVFIQPGTYTENLTLSANVNLVAFVADKDTPTVSIVGKITASFSGSAALSGIRLVTNADNCLVQSGANACNLTLSECYISVLTAVTGIVCSNSNGSSKLQFFHCRGDLSNGSAIYFNYSGTGKFKFFNCVMENNGASTAASVSSGTGFDIYWTFFTQDISITAGTSLFYYSTCGNVTITNAGQITNAFYTTFAILTLSNTSTAVANYCSFGGGSSSAITINAGTTCTLGNCRISSSNTNAITGAGSLTYGSLFFTGSSSNINVTTQTLLYEGPSRKVGSSNSGATNSLTVINDSNTASSSANIVASVAGGTAADPTHQSVISGVTTWTWGADNSDSDAFVLAASATLGTSNRLRVTTDGILTTYAGRVVSLKTPGGYPYTTLATDYVILVDTSAARTITPLASPATGQTFVIKDSVGSAGTNNITVSPSGKNIDGAASYVMTSNYQAITIVYNGTEWSII